VMSAEMAAEMIAAEDGPRVLLCEAPLVEGAVAAAARARGGAALEEVADEARAALGMKSAQLGIEQDGGELPATEPFSGGDGSEVRLHVDNRLGLHARPAARFVETAGRFDAQVTVSDETTGRGPADARSLSALLTLGVRRDHVIVVHARGADADAVLAALRELAEANFGDEDGDGPEAPAPETPTLEAPPGPTPPAPTDLTPPPSGARLRGVPASSGIAIGPARLVALTATPTVDAPPGEPEAERARLDEARVAARSEVEAARAAIAERAGEAEAGIFDAHLLLLDDAALLEPARRAIDQEDRSAAGAWRSAAEAVAASYRALDDPYLRERAADVEDVAGRVLRHLAGEAGPSAPTAAGILVAPTLTPSQAAGLDRDLVRGLAIAHGGATSHAAILARALGIPSVVGLGEALLGVVEGTPLVLDGDAGTLEVDPGAATVAERERARTAGEARARRVRERASEPARTRDGATIEVATNVGRPEEVAAAVALGADGVGLLRTEFLFLERDSAPSESEQQRVYREIAEALGGRPLVVRTLDAGADKPLLYLRQAPEDNPFLGVRGIRLGLAQPELLAPQLRAILAVAVDHPLSVMFPMVTTLAEYRAARDLLEEARAELGAPTVPVGIMVEVPAVAIAAERFAAAVDFFSIGTNDLAQYTMAAERGNEALAELLAGPLPPVLGLISKVTAAAHAHGRWVGVCGELAGDPAAAVLLAGLGVTELSMAASRIPEVKEALRGVTLTRAREVAAQALELDDSAAVSELVAELLDPR
jgi:multiphosphoryl transfer protein